MGIRETSSYTAIIFVKRPSCLYFWWVIDRVTDLRFDRLERRCICHFMWKVNMYFISNYVVQSDNHRCDDSLSADQFRLELMSGRLLVSNPVYSLLTYSSILALSFMNVISNTFPCTVNKPSLVLTMACRLLSAKPLSELMLENCSLET